MNLSCPFASLAKGHWYPPPNTWISLNAKDGGQYTSKGGRGSLFCPMPFQKALSLWLGSWPHMSGSPHCDRQAKWLTLSTAAQFWARCLAKASSSWPMTPLEKTTGDNSIHFLGIWNDKPSHFLKKQGQDECTDILFGDWSYGASSCVPFTALWRYPGLPQ